ncbi:hypothetical protein AVEN_79805-1 [Araneus ventricosus]|uniref:Uncharacterized protein n=1 Tax=Araneus ventricosus TaxID=182803 RepID=A0A4Y2IRX9_ARAVE|nr:hypothetical protein AVEN_21269-1 [Araneus ventricosus]GBM86278.1 hypothetical protein AVEN_79805-1 [Araneus ventricosus]
MNCQKGYSDEIKCTIAPRSFNVTTFSWTTHCILYTTFSTAESNMSPGMLSTARNMLSFKVVSIGTPTKIDLGFEITPQEKVTRGYPGRMDMENAYRMLCVVHEKGGHIESY